MQKKKTSAIKIKTLLIMTVLVAVFSFLLSGESTLSKYLFNVAYYITTGSATKFDLVSIGAISAPDGVYATKVLTAGIVAPSDADSTVTYQWYRSQTPATQSSFAAITGATSKTYTPVQGDIGYSIEVQATGDNIHYQGTVTSAYVGPVQAVSLTGVSISGATSPNPRVEDVLTPSVTPSGATVSYTWYRSSDGTTLGTQLATTSTYTIASSDYNYYIIVQAVGSGCYTGTKQTATAAKVVYIPLTQVSIPSTAAVGTAISASTTPSGAAATATYSWQWSTTSGGAYTAISGATSQSYTPTSTYVGDYLKVTATGAGDYSGSQTSSASGPVTSAMTSAAINGTAVVGHQLTASFTPSAAIVSYQWQRSDTTNINGTYSNVATTSYYNLTSADNTYYIKLIVTGTGNYTGSATSSAVGQVASYQLTSISDITGSVCSGQTLTAGTVYPTGATVSYQWQTIDSGTGAIANIGTNSSAYTLTSAEIGKYIQVVATGTGSYTGSVTSEPTITTVASSTTSISSWTIGTIAGSLTVGSVLTAGAVTNSGVTATVTYQWMHSASSGSGYTAITGATGSTYTITASDYNSYKYIEVVETGCGAYSGTKTSAYVGPVTQCTITGITDIIGTTYGTPPSGLTLTAGTALPAGATVSYQWKWGTSLTSLNNVPSGGTSSTYSGLSTGYFYEVVVTGTGAYTGTAISNVVGPVANGTATSITAIGNIAGDAKVGSVLTAGDLTAGSNPPNAISATYQWQRAYYSGGSYTAIAGATGRTYTTTSDDLGCCFKVTATGSVRFTGTLTSAEFGPINATPITAIGDISGSTTAGSVLTAGAVSPSGATVTYQWQRSDSGIAGVYTNIYGAASNLYTVTGTDSYRYLRVVVTGTGGYSGTVTSAPTAARASTGTATAVGGSATITGTTTVGQKLTAVTTSITPATATYTYQWMKCTTSGGTYAAIPGAASSTYTLTAADYNYYLKVAITGSGLYSGTITSSATSAAVAAVSITGIGDVIGPAQNGLLLTAGTVFPLGATVTYQWWYSTAKTGGTLTSITGAINSTYRVNSGTARYYYVVVTGTGAYTGTVTSTRDGPTTSSLTNVTAITFTGTAQVGSTLTAGTPTPSAATVTYQWQKSAASGGAYSDIPGAVSSTYVLAAADVGYYVRLEVSGSGAYTSSAASSPTSVVAACPVTAVASITGTAKVGYVLTAGAPTPSAATVTYQWQYSSDGTTFTDLPGQTDNTYVCPSELTSQYVRVAVTGCGGYSGTVYSAKTSQIAS